MLLVNNLAPNVHPWVLKRYLPVTIPLLVLLAASTLGRLAARGGLQRGAAAVVTIPYFFPF